MADQACPNSTITLALHAPVLVHYVQMCDVDLNSSANLPGRTVGQPILYGLDTTMR